ncbi:MAG: DUF4783 domain-containing protein [Bacteroidales bacterium]
MSITVSAQIPQKINNGLAEGNAEYIYSYLNDNVELTVLDRDDVCSKEQARQVIENFFKNNKPSEYRVIHVGGVEPKFYVVGTIKTKDNRDYRVYFLIKGGNNNQRIFQLRIEEQKS